MRCLLQIIGGCRGRTLLNTIASNRALIRPIIRLHHEEFPKPFDNLPFSAPNRYVLTAVFSVMFGLGWWTPWGILWYSMAKHTM